MSEFGEKMFEFKLSKRVKAALAGSALLLSGCTTTSTLPTPANTSSSASIAQTNEASPSPRLDSCEPFDVFAQNRWEPYGAAIRAEPDVTDKPIGGYVGNTRITVDGWEDTGEAAYPNNPKKWRGNVWFRVADEYADGDDNRVWISSAAVRAVKTQPDPTGGYGEGGRPAPEPARCEIG